MKVQCFGCFQLLVSWMPCESSQNAWTMNTRYFTYFKGLTSKNNLSVEGIRNHHPKPWIPTDAGSSDILQCYLGKIVCEFSWNMCKHVPVDSHHPLHQFFVRAWIFFWDFFLFFGLASFSLRFPLVFLHFPYLSFVFHRNSLVFIVFPLVLLHFPNFSVVFHRFSLVFQVFPLFCLHFLNFPSFCFVSLRLHWFDCIFIISLYVYTLVFFHVFLLLVFSIVFLVLYCIFLIVLLFLPWICFIGFPVSLVFLHLPVYYGFSCIGFCSLSSLFSVATYMLGACCCCCCCCCWWWWWWWWWLLFWYFHVFSVGWRLKATMIMLVNDAAVLLSLHEVAAGGQP